MTGCTAVPDERAMLAHLAWLCLPAMSANSALRLEIAWGPSDVGPVSGRTFALTELRDAASFAAWINLRNCNVYVGVTLRCADAPAKGRTRAEAAVLATSLAVDIDADFAATADRIACLAKPQLMVLTGRQPALRGQLFIRVEPTTDLVNWEVLQERVVVQFGGDENALGRNRLMRLAGSVSYPSSRKLQRGYVTEATSAHFVPSAPEYLLADLLAQVPPAPTTRLVATLPAQPSIRISPRTKPPLTVVEAALRGLPDSYAIEHRLWLKVGFALFDYDCGQHGLGLWQRFSHRCSGKAAVTDFTKLWRDFSRPYSGHRITLSWLLREARRAASNVGEQHG